MAFVADTFASEVWCSIPLISLHWYEYASPSSHWPRAFSCQGFLKWKETQIRYEELRATPNLQPAATNTQHTNSTQHSTTKASRPAGYIQLQKVLTAINSSYSTSGSTWRSPHTQQHITYNIKHKSIERPSAKCSPKEKADVVHLQKSLTREAIPGVSDLTSRNYPASRSCHTSTTIASPYETKPLPPK